METTKVMQHLIGKSYREIVDNLNIEDYPGDCCGYAEWDVTDEIAQKLNSDSAVLKDVVMIEYEEYSSDRCVVNFIFDLGEERGLILGYDLTAGSGSGWAYGAFCTLSFKDEEIATASY